MSAPPKRPLPLTIITGFLGSGKTTLLNRLVASPAFSDAAVLVNELGEVGIDHLLVRHARDDLVVLESGCVCCTLRQDLVQQLTELLDARGKQAVPAFSRIILETTGIADPSPIVQTVVKHPELADACFLDGIIATVDAKHYAETAPRHPECEAQIAIADRLLITKIDLATEADVQALRRSLEQRNPTAEIASASMGKIDPSFVRGVGHLDTRRGIGGPASPHSAHDKHGVQRLAVTLPRPVAFDALSLWLAMLTQLHGERLLRLKAVVSARGERAPVAVQAVHHVVYPPLALPEMPGLAGRSHVVLLMRDMDDGELAEIRASLEALAAPPEAPAG